MPNASDPLAAPEIVFVAVGSAGDVFPLAALAGEMVRRGLRVWLMAPPSQAAVAERLGLVFHALGQPEDEAAATADPALWHRVRGFEVLWPFLLQAGRETLARLQPLADSGQRPLLVGSTMALGARMAHELWRWPHVTAQVSPCWTFSAHRVPRLPGLGFIGWLPQAARAPAWAWVDRHLLDRVAAPGLNTWRAELGLAPVERVVGRWAASPQQVLGLYPASFAPPQPDWPRRLALCGFPMFDGAAGEPLAPELDAFLGTSREVLVFSAGSAMRHADEFFATAARVAQDLDRRALFLGPVGPQRWPGHVLAWPYAPLSRVLPRAAALVSHPGIGTIAQALSSGVPQLLTPYAFDHFDNAALAERQGVALRLAPGAGRWRMRRALRRLLGDPAWVQRCRVAAGEAMDGSAALATAGDLLQCRLSGDAAPA